MDNSKLQILVSAVLESGSLDKINGEIDALKIHTLQIPISVSTQEIKRILGELNVEIGKSNASQPKIKVFDTGDLDSKKIKYFEGIADIENRVKAFYSTTGKTDVTLFKNAQKDITGFTASVTDSQGIVERFKFKLSQLGTALGDQPGFVYSGGGLADKLIGKDYEAKMNKVLTLSNQVSLAQSKAFDGTKSVKEATHVTELKDRYEEIISTLYDVNTSADALSQEQIRNIQTQINQVKALAKNYQELEYAASKLAPKSIDFLKTESTGNLETLEMSWKKQGILVGKLKSDVVALKAELAGVSDQGGLDTYNHKLNLLTSDAKQATIAMKAFDVTTNQDILKNKMSIFLRENPKSLSVNKAEFTRLAATIKNVTNQTELGKWNKDFQDVTGNIDAMGKKGENVFGSLLKNMGKFAGWIISSGAVMAAITSIKQMVANVISLDKVLVDLRMATGYTYEETSKLMGAYNALGQEIGATTGEIANSANEWLRQGMSISDTNTMIKNSMILSKIGMISSAEATQFLTSATKGYGVEISKTLNIVDMLAAVDMKSATSAGGLAEAMSKTSASASIAGVTMQQLIGFIATVGEVTQKDMSSVGESFNFGAAAA
jgi:hypothetical protein